MDKLFRPSKSHAKLVIVNPNRGLYTSYINGNTDPDSRYISSYFYNVHMYPNVNAKNGFKFVYFRLEKKNFSYILDQN